MKRIDKIREILWKLDLKLEQVLNCLIRQTVKKHSSFVNWGVVKRAFSL